MLPWVALQVYPVVHSGTVAVLKTGFGFLESGSDDARSRIYFAASEARAALGARRTCFDKTPCVS